MSGAQVLAHRARPAAAAEAAHATVTTPALCAGLLLWGWLNALLPVAVCLCVPLVLARFVTWRLALDDKDYNRASDVSAAGLVLLLLYLFDRYSVGGIYHLLRWLPLALYVLLLVQTFGSRRRIKYSALFWSVRRAERRGAIADSGSLDFRGPYFVMCLAAAGASPGGSGSHFGAGVAAVLLFWLWSVRPGRHRYPVWIAAAALSLGVAWIVKSGVIEARRMAEPVLMRYFQDRIWKYRDPYSSYTAIGHIGRLKTSERIMLRVVPDAGGSAVPTLLREAVYQVFSRNLWLGESGRFRPLSTDIEGETWRIEPRNPGEQPASKTVRVVTYLRAGKGLIATPSGTRELVGLPVEDLLVNHLGVLKVLVGPPLIDYAARYEGDGALDSQPRPIDTTVPQSTKQVFERVAQELRLRELSPEAAVARVRAFFSDGFSYTLDLVGPKPEAGALESFVLEHKRGHCEYFATATALLLRAGGVPARYAVGYSVQEWSELEQAYLVRRRHAHSWALAHLNGRWVDVDTTPAAWVPFEADAAPWWQPGFDLVSWLRYRFTRWRTLEEEADNAYLLWLTVPLVVVLLWRLSRSERVPSSKAGAGRASPRFAQPGLDSALYRVVEALEAGGLERRASEPLGEWFARLDRQGVLRQPRLVIDTLLPMHYRLRFDPAAGGEERAALERGVGRWFAAPMPRRADL